MTKEQEEQFAENGCACSFLIALYKMQKDSQFNKDSFINIFDKEYPFWKSQKCCGLTNIGMVLGIARKLSLAGYFQLFLNKDRVRDAITKEKVCGVLLFTEKREVDGKFVEHFHCSLVSPKLVDGTKFQLIDVNNEPRLSPIVLDDTTVDELRGYFLLLYPKPAEATPKE